MLHQLDPACSHPEQQHAMGSRALMAQNNDPGNCLVLDDMFPDKFDPKGTSGGFITQIACTKFRCSAEQTYHSKYNSGGGNIGCLLLMRCLTRDHGPVVWLWNRHLNSLRMCWDRRFLCSPEFTISDIWARREVR
jgi:hypothetical protein